MAHSSGSSFLSSLSAELPDSIKLQQQVVRLEEEKKRLARMAEKKEQQLLKVCMRLVLEYSSEVWVPYLLKHIYAIENVQRHFTRRIDNFEVYDYKTRLFILDLESFEEMRSFSNNLYTRCYAIIFVDYFCLMYI